MRLIYGALAFIIWSILGLYMISQGVVVSNDIQILSTAIVVAGAMAGGDDIK